MLSSLTKTQAPVTIIIYSVAKMKLENNPCTVFKLLHRESFYSGFPIQINSKIEIRGSYPCQCIKKCFIELSLHLVFEVKVFGQNSVE